ncbi:MAG: GreA/GreB family elongation factor [Bacillota bacterium]
MRRVMRLSRAAREAITKQMVQLEDYLREVEKLENDPWERERCRNFITDYLKQMEGLLASAKEVDEAGDNVMPVVIIGCRVNLQGSDGGDLSVCLCSPAKADIDEGDVSVFSPVGRAILFKAVGEEVSVEAPGGLFKYRIKDVRFEAR